MAKVKFSALVSDMRNKLNGSVFSKNRGGSYLRNKVTPVNAQTDAQMQVRGFFTSLAQAWRSLTEAQRKSFYSAVENFKKTDIFGDVKTPSGSNLFQKLGLNALNTGNPFLTSAPSSNNAPGSVDIDIDADFSAQTLEISADIATVPGNENYLVYATAPLSPGKAFVKNQYRLIGVLAAVEAFPYDASAQYIAKFGPLVLGKRISVKVVPINTQNFVNGGPAQATTLVHV